MVHSLLVMFTVITSSQLITIVHLHKRFLQVRTRDHNITHIAKKKVTLLPSHECTKELCD